MSGLGPLVLGVALAIGEEPAAPPARGASRYEIQCALLELGPGESATAPVRLQSRQVEERCRPGPGPEGRVCEEETVFVWHETVRARVLERASRASRERETFRACLSGPWIGFEVVAGGRDYSWTARREAGGVSVDLTAGAQARAVAAAPIPLVPRAPYAPALSAAR